MPGEDWSWLKRVDPTKASRTTTRVPRDVVATIWDAVDAGQHEVLADQVRRDVRAALSGPVEALYPSLAG